MSRMKLVFAALLVAAIASVAPQANAQVTLKVMIAGSSGIWQAMGVGTYKDGSCPTGSAAGCAHYTAKTFVLNDTRPVGKGGTAVQDTGASIWLVWDNTTADPNCASACNLWAYIKVDSTVGARCYFAQPQCNATAPSTGFPAPGNVISSTIWGADSTPPAPIQALFTASSGVKVNVAAVDVRPEDTAVAQCRSNSQLGGGSDGLNGLGYIQSGGTNAPGTCPAFGATLTNLQGTDFTSSYPSSTAVAHSLAFNISGKDPYNGTTVPAFTTVAIGAIPVVFVTSHAAGSQLAGVTDASPAQLQTVFSGANCDGSVFAGGVGGGIAAYLREPLSGTMNTIEYTAFRYPRDSSGNFSGASQETGINSANPPTNIPCGAGGRWGVVGTGDEVNSVVNSRTNNGLDGIGYTFFSYGNVKALADSTSYSYLTINGDDPIFQVYGSGFDPGQPATAGELPGTADLPSTCAGGAGNFPCAENKIWKGGLSFPNVRSGAYKQWSIVRLVSTGTALTNAKALVASTQQSAVTTVPDFIPAVKTVAGGITDPGLLLYRSHYTQDGVAPVNGITTDKGGEEGGCIIAPVGATKVVQRSTGCAVGP